MQQRKKLLNPGKPVTFATFATYFKSLQYFDKASAIFATFEITVTFQWTLLDYDMKSFAKELVKF